MKIPELKDSRRYELTRDVENPNLDKRQTYEPGKLAWKKGDRFRAVVTSDRPFDDEREITRIDLRAIFMQATNRNAIGRIGQHHDGFEALVDALDLLPESVSDKIAQAGYDPSCLHSTVFCSMFQTLIDEGKITLDDVQRIARIEYERPEEG